jgi:hypothetical protein
MVIRKERHMPYDWIDPELFLEHEGVAVYHCYDDDGMVSTYWYTTDGTDCNIDAPLTEAAQFDVRELPTLGLAVNDPTTHASIIRHATQAGLLTGESAIPSDLPSLVMEQPPDIPGDLNASDEELIDEKDPCTIDPSQMPDLETLMACVDEGVCEATDGCVVEPDGVCPHGCKSWLLELGLI